MLKIPFNNLKGAFILQMRKYTSVEVGKWTANFAKLADQMDVPMVLKTCECISNFKMHMFSAQCSLAQGRG